MKTFPACAFLVGRSLVFGAEGRFWKESWVSMGTSGESLSGSYSSSDESQKTVVSVGSSSGNG